MYTTRRSQARGEPESISARAQSNLSIPVVNSSRVVQNSDASSNASSSRLRSQSAQSKLSTMDAEEEYLDYWDRFRIHSTPIPILYEEINHFISTAPKKIFETKRNPLDQEFARRTPKLAELNMDELGYATRDKEADHRNAAEHPTRPSKSAGHEGIGGLGSERTSSRRRPTSSAMERSEQMRGKSPLNKFLEVPIETLSLAKPQNHVLKNKFPTSERSDAFMRYRKVKTGSTFVDLVGDEREYADAFPVQSCKGTKDRKKAINLSDEKPRNGLRSSRTSVTSLFDDNGGEMSRRNSVLNLRKLIAKAAIEDTSRLTVTQRLQRNSSAISLQSTLTDQGNRSNESHSSRLQHSELGSVLLESKKANPKSKSGAHNVDEDMKLFQVATEKELTDIVKILDDDAGLVTNWRNEFTSQKDELKKSLGKTLDTRRSKRENGYHNRALLSKVGDIVYKHNFERATLKTPDGLWDNAKSKLEHDRSAFPNRKAFYQGLVDFIQKDGGIRSVQEEKFVFAIKRRMDERFPISSRLVYDLAMEFGGEMLLDTDYQHIVKYVCEECKVTFEELARYIASQGLLVAPKKPDDSSVPESEHITEESTPVGTADSNPGNSTSRSSNMRYTHRHTQMRIEAIPEQPTILLSHLPSLYDEW